MKECKILFIIPVWPFPFVNAILSPSMELCIVVTDDAMSFLVPSESAMYVTCGHSIIYDMTLSTSYDKGVYVYTDIICIQITSLISQTGWMQGSRRQGSHWSPITLPWGIEDPTCVLMSYWIYQRDLFVYWVFAKFVSSVEARNECI